MVADTHNHGLNVRRIGQWVEKPRPIYWEWLFLSAKSPLRVYFENKENNPFSGFPDADVQFYKVGYLPFSGRISFFKTETEQSLSNKDAYDLGSALAVVLFFGLSDMHKENLAWVALENSVSIFPIDIEIVFDRIKYLSESYAVNARGITHKFSGINHLAKMTHLAPDIIDGFCQSISCLNENIQQINDIFSRLPLSKIPIRYLIRNTEEYAVRLKEKDFSGLHPEEVEQLERGDIPYFFRYIGSNTIFHVSNYKIAATRIPINTENSLNIESHQLLTSYAEKDLKASALQISRTFSLSAGSEFENENVYLKYDSQDIYLGVHNLSWKLKCKKLNS